MNEEIQQPARRRRSRAARRHERLNPVVEHHSVLKQTLSPYEVVDAEGVEIIHELAMRTVEEIGVEFRDEESLQVWRSAGAQVSGERVCCDRAMLLELVAKAPEQFVHHARNDERSVQVGGPNTVVSPSYGPPFVYDLDGLRRHATIEDLHNFQKLNHMASSVHIAGGPIVEPMDVPVATRHLHMTFSALKHSDKPIVGNVTSAQRAKDTLDMLALVFGKDFVSDHTVCTSLINSNSPLVWDATMLDALKFYAANNQAVMCSPFSMTAASMPASNTGAMALITAEALMAIGFAQIIRPGAPMLFGVPAMTVALNTGAPVHGSPDSATVQFLAGAMARRYKVPHRSIANCATSKTTDMQAGSDSMWGLFPSFLSGANWITMSGGMLEGTLGLGYAKAMLDFEQLDAFYHFCQGSRFEDFEEIFETIKDVGPGGHFLGSAHTRKANLFLFPSQNNVTYEQWVEDGERDAAEVGSQRARAWLTRYETPPMEQALDEALRDFVRRREHEIMS